MGANSKEFIRTGLGIIMIMNTPNVGKNWVFETYFVRRNLALAQTYLGKNQT